MLKRLLIAVLALSFVLAFTGTAFSEIYPEADAVKLNSFDSSNPKAGLLKSVLPIQPASRALGTNVQKLPAGVSIPAPPLATFCQDLWYDGGAAFFWLLGDAYPEESLMNVRYTSDANFSCTLKTFWLNLYGPAMVGTPDMMVYLWEDDGFGFPGLALDSIFVPNASLPTTFAWMSFDFFGSPNAPVGGWVFADGEEYHYGIKVLDSGTGTDEIAMLIDDGTGPNNGQARTSFFDTNISAWGTMLGVYGTDYTMVQSSENCCGEIPFTDCYSQSYYTGLAFLWSVPDDTWGNTEYSVRFDVGGPETLVSTDFYIYDAGDGHFGDDDVIVTIYGDAAGLPDGVPVFSATLPAGTYVNGWNNVAVGMVFDASFHISLTSSGTPGVAWEYILTDDGTNPQGHSSTLDGGVWMTMAASWGGDYAPAIWANMCRDQFSECKTKSYYNGLAFTWGIGNGFRDAASVRMKVDGIYCQVNEAAFLLYDVGDPTTYTHDSKISIYTDAAGLPGTELASVIIPAASHVLYPALQTADFSGLDVYVSGDYHVVFESLNGPTNDSGVVFLSDDGTFNNGGRSTGLFVASGVWETMVDHYGDDYGWVAFGSHCCTPFPERACDPLVDAGWSTYQGSQARTGASELSLGDSWCNLNLNWSFDGPNAVSFTGPVISGDFAVCSFTSSYIVFDIITGAPVYTLDNTFGDGNLIGTDGIRCAPAIVGGVMYISGGSSNGIGAVDFATGTLIWQRTIATGGPTSIYGQTRFSVMTVLNDGVDDILYFTTDNGAVAAVYAATGALYAGWATNPIYLGNPLYISGATDGTSLFYATQSGASDGDIVSVDAFTGIINWQLTATDGLIASGEAGYNGYPEGFRGGVAYQNGALYAVSWANDVGANDHPIDGWFYAVDAGSGSHIVPPTKTNRAIYSTVTVDQNAIYAPTLSQWANPTDPTGGNLIAFQKSTGAQIWGAKTADDANYYSSAILTCEPGGVDDRLYVFNANGFFECYDTKDGNQLFRRRVDHPSGSEVGLAGALAMTATDGIHMMFADFYGGLYDFTLGADRPRMEIQAYQPNVAVEFGSNPALPVNVGPIMVNTGCLDLNIASAQVDELPITGASFPDFAVGYVAEDMMARAATIADDMQREAFLSKSRLLEDNLFDTEAIFDVKSDYNEKATSRFAAGIPAWFVSLDAPIAGDIVAAGDSADLLITVNQPLINRGPQSVYIAWGSDDPDFFLNAAADAAGFLPGIKLTVVGGCLTDTTELNFGGGSSNIQLVTNTGRLGTGDWTPHGFDIDGDNASFYQGTLIYGTSKYAIAMNTQDWSSGGGETDAWTSMQADPNYCDNQCKPALTAGVAVGAITSDGLTYTAISADMVCKTYIDSVENFDTDPDPLVTAWAWNDFSVKSFDDTLTMGLTVNARVIGVSDLPALANLTLEIMDFTERNGNPVSNWYLGSVIDYDVGSDIATFDQSISTAWAHNPAADAAWGSIKIPFGCGTVGAGQDFDYTSVRNIKGLDGNSALFTDDLYHDSAYTYLSAPYGTVLPTQPQSADFEMHTGYASHDFAGGDSYSIGIAHFGVTGLADATSGAELADMANLVNKWAGFGRGDVNNDGGINLADIIYLAGTVNNAGPGAIPFAHMGDVNADGAIDAGDINYLVDYYFNCGPCPIGDWMF